MANPVVSVLLKLKDELSDGLTKAGGGIKGFFTSLSGLIATAALGKFFKDSIDEAGKSEASMAKLALAVRNTGNDFQKLQPSLSGTINKLAELTTFTDEDLSDALANLVTITGDVTGSQKNLALVADLAIAKQMGLSAASDVVGKAMNGNVTALNKMGFAGKDATAAIETLRTSVNGAAADFANTFQGRLENLSKGWGEFKESVGRAILSTDSAGKSVSGLTTLLADMAHWVEQNQNVFGGLTDGMVAFGSAMGPIAEWIGKKFVAGLLGIEFAAGYAMQALAKLVELGSFLLGKLGIDVGEGMATKLREGGEKMVTAAEQAMARLNTVVSEADIARNKAAEAAATKRTKLTKQGLADQEKAEQEYAKNVRDATEELAALRYQIETGVTEKEAKEWVKRQVAMKASLGVQVKDLKDAYGQIDTAHTVLKASFDTLIPKVKQTETTVKTLTASAVIPHTTAVEILAKKYGITTAEAEKMIGKLGGSGGVKFSFDEGARAAIGMGQALGVLDDKAAAALQNLVSIGTSLGTDNVVGVIGGLAGLLGSIFAGDAERLAAIRENAEATEKLASVNGELVRLNTPGRVQAGAEKLFAPGSKFWQGFKGSDSEKLGQLLPMLKAAGITLGELKALGKDYGFDLTDKNGGLDFSRLGALGRALPEVQFSAFADTFSDQMKRIGIGKGIGAIAGGEELGQVVGAVGIGGNNALLGALQGLDLSGSLGTQKELTALQVERDDIEKRRDAVRKELASGKLGEEDQQSLSNTLMALNKQLSFNINSTAALTERAAREQAPVDEAVANLRSLFNNIGTLKPEDFGGLTGPEFLDAIERLVGLLTDTTADLGGVLVPADLGELPITPFDNLPVTFDLMAQQGAEQIDVLGQINAGIQELIGVASANGSGGAAGAADTTLGDLAQQLDIELARIRGGGQSFTGSVVR